VWGEELYLDSTKVDANAAINKMIERTESEVVQLIEELWKNGEGCASAKTLQDLVEKYNGERLTGTRKPTYKRITDEKVSLTDPDAAPMRAQGGGSAVLGYRADAKVCDVCLVKDECTGSKSGRHIFRSFYQEYIDKVKAYHETEAYKKASRKRSVWVEPLFGEAKDFHRLRRFRLRGLHKVNIEGMMIAAGQNLKRLIKHRLEKLCFFGSISDFSPISHRSSTFSTAWYVE